ncbi:MAG: putative ABC-type transport system involved in lysophospholipase L1 biosynthesis ATPase subunit [Verrucomicrobiales bacterium]
MSSLISASQSVDLTGDLPAAGRLEALDIVQWFKVGGATINVLNGISVQVPAGQRMFLCGASGAGKTTLLYVLAGLERPASGQVLVGDVSLYDASAAAQARIRNVYLGYVFQHFNLLPELTALENVALPSQIAGQLDRDRAADLLGKVGLSRRLQHLPAELSGGEQQRVAIARALANEPQILFADEPTGNLDPKTGAEVMGLLLDVAAESGKTLVVVTHDQRLAQMGDRCLTIEDGRIVDEAAG